ncbi:LemA family protein [Blastochloris viridis]|uniref:LemA family protein n=1 Tax=Blastochloris viridis TaxID=1079 RepID=A0A0H5B9L3_BLAVI|nr:LemA family protein [Blastochloris viridis]ALK07852.1 LemA family protein [Blastochloris viridis]BAR98902.1 LemA protein [Blastochloris viridis]CUU43774.1 LemA family protein [Blastochloris viridis]
MGWLVLGVIVAAALWAVVVYNRLVALRQAVNNAEGDIDVQLRQRFDLVPQLVETVKGYAQHESGVLERITEARTAVAAADTPAAKMAAEAGLSRALGGLIAVAEAYPDLKASANFQTLQTQLMDIEDKIAAARRFLNNSVSEYNASIAQIPAVLFATRLGFAPAQFYDLPADRAAEINEPVKVSFK